MDKTAAKRGREPVTVANLLTQLRQMNDVCHTQAEDDKVLGTSDVMADQWRRELPDLDVAPFTLALRIRRVGMLLDESLDSICKGLGIKLGDFLLLMALRRLGPHGALKPTQIMKMHSVTSGTVTYRIDKLVALNVVNRVRDPADLRGYLIQLTDHGCKIVDDGVQSSADIIKDALSQFMQIDDGYDAFTEMLRHFELKMEAGSNLLSGT